MDKDKDFLNLPYITNQREEILEDHSKNLSMMHPNLHLGQMMVVLMITRTGKHVK
jgi:hypothetical protein